MFQKKELVNSCNQQNEDMKKYIQLEKDQFSKVGGTCIRNLKTAQAKNKKLKELKTRAEKALYFRELFGLLLDCSRLKDPDSSKTYTVEFNTTKKGSFEDLPDNSVSQDGNPPETQPVDLLPDTQSVDPPPPLLTDNLSTPLPEKQSNCVHQNSFQSETQLAGYLNEV